MAAAPGGGFADAFGGVFDEIFGGLGGGGGRWLPNVHRGADLRYNLEITLNKRSAATETKIRIPTMEIREPCNGSGAAGYRAQDLSDLQTVRGPGSCPAGFLSIQQTCPKCHGTGRFHCRTMQELRGGADAPSSTRRCRSRFPPGSTRAIASVSPVKARTRRQRRPARRPSMSRFTLKQHPVFSRDHNDLHCEMPISFTTAALGEKSRSQR